MTLPSTAPPATERRHRTFGWYLAAATVVGMLAMWGYVLYLAFGPGRQAPPDRLDDPAFARAAQTICSEAHAVVGQLPLAVDVKTASERASVIDEANRTFARMLDDLDAIRPSGADGQLVGEWLADWRTYLGDREAYAAALHTDPNARLLVTAKNRQQITEYLDGFAADNKMTACATPIDV